MRDFSRARILSGVRRHVFLWAEKLKITNYFFGNFNMTFQATSGCASDFLEVLPKFKMAARGQLKHFCGRKNSTLKTEIIRILLSHSARYGDVQVTFSRFY